MNTVEKERGISGDERQELADTHPSQNGGTDRRDTAKGSPGASSRIRFRLAGLVVACVLPLLIAAGFIVYHSYGVKQELIDRHMLDTARALTQVVDRELGNMQTSLSVLATSPSLDSGDLAAFHRQAEVVLKAYPGGDIILADAGGQQLVNSYRPFGTPLPKRSVPENAQRVYATGKPSITNLFKGALTGRPLIGVDVPVIRDGRVVYDLAMTLPADRLATVLAQQNLPPDWFGTILDSNRVVVSRTRFPEKYIGHQATPGLQRVMDSGAVKAEVRNLENILVIVNFNRSATSGWTVVIGVPKSVVTAELWRWLAWMIAATLLLSITGIWLAVPIARGVARIEEDLRDNREWLRVTLSSIGDAVLTTDTKGRVTFLNPVAAAITGWQPDEAEGQPIQSVFSIINEKTRMTGEDLVSQVLKRGHVIELANHTALLARDGREIPIEDSAAPIFDNNGKIIGVVIVFHNVAERRRTEDALRESEQKFRTLADAIPQLCWMGNADGWLFWYNQRWYEFTGTTPEQMAGWGWQSVHDPQALPQVLEQWTASIATGEPFEMVFPLRRADGVFHLFLTRGVPLKNAEGKVVRWFGTNTDIDEQKKTEDALRVSEARLQLFIDHAPASLAMFDRKMRYLYASQRWIANYHIEDRDLKGLSHYEVFPEISPEWKANHQRALAGEVLHSDGERFERADGSVQWIRWEIRPWYDAKGEVGGIVIFSEDITERKRAESALQTTLQRFYLILSNMNPGVLLVTSEGRVEFANQAFCDQFALKEAPADLAGLDAGETIDKIREAYGNPDEALTRIQEIVDIGEPVTSEEVAMQGGRTFLRDFVPLKVQGTLVGRMWIHLDITERKRAELRITHLASFPELNVNPIVESDLEGKFTYANPAAQRQGLLLRENCAGHPLLANWPSAISSLKAGPERSIEREVDNDGRLFLQRIHYLSDLGVIRAYYSDITERRQAEAALLNRQSETVLATLADFVPQMVWMCTSDGLNTYFNHRWVEYTGLTLEESYGRGWNTPFHPDDKQTAWEAWNHAIQTGEQYHVESRLRAADGTYRWFLMRGAPLTDTDGGIVRWFGTCTDIEDLKQAGQTLLVAQRKLTETVVNQLPCCVALVRGRDLTFQLVNPAYRAILPGKEILGKSVHEVWSDKPGFEELCREVLKTGVPHFAVDEPSLVGRSSSGGHSVTAYFTWSMYRVDLPGEDDRGLLITEWETTERKQAEEAMRSSQAKLQSIVGSAMDAVISVDESQHIVLFNRSAETVFQCTASDALGTNLDRFIPDAVREVHREHIRCFGIDGISQRSMTSPAILVGVRSNGEEFPIEATISQVYAEGKKLFTVILRDITESKLAEKALLRSEKLASVGRMAATIAHEINNPLAATTNALYIAMHQKDLPETTRDYLEIADAELKRIAHITRQSLGFYREGNAPALTSVNAVLESAIDLLKSKINAKHAVIAKEWDGDAEIMAVAGELRQVFSNLLANSLDAIDAGGIIKLRVSPCTAPRNGHRSVRVTIADNGGGIPASSKQHLFEPFFTTKGTIGTGLGLWVSKQIIDKHAGTIRMRSSSNGERTGTVFSLVLPIEPASAGSTGKAAVTTGHS